MQFVIGQKHLNLNDYDTIVIDDLIHPKIGYTIKVANKNNKKNNPRSAMTLEDFSSNLKGLDATERITTIIDYFLQNNLICSLMQENGVNVISIDKKCLTIKAFFQKEDHQFLSITSQKIYEKYIQDRMCFLQQNEEIKKYSIVANSQTMAYTMLEEKEKNCLQIDLFKTVNGNLKKEEMQFLRKFVLDNLIKEAELAILKIMSKENNTFNFEISCKELKIYCQNISKQDLKEMQVLIEEYNKNIEEQKKESCKGRK